MSRPASENAYRKAWEVEIEYGQQKGKLARENGKADIAGTKDRVMPLPAKAEK